MSSLASSFWFSHYNFRFSKKKQVVCNALLTNVIFPQIPNIKILAFLLLQSLGGLQFFFGLMIAFKVNLLGSAFQIVTIIATHWKIYPKWSVQETSISVD